MAAKLVILIESLVFYTLGAIVLCNGSYNGTTPRPQLGVTCKSWQFSCLDGLKCIPEVQECDGITDCDDGSDEGNQCTYFTCGDGRTVSMLYICDGYFDCLDQSDESETKANCTKFECANGKKLPLHFLCNEVDDCNDTFRSDECDCDFQTFICSNKKCIHFFLKCDGTDDCGDNSDEFLCDAFTCKNGKVVDVSLTCNGVDDCDDTSDECDCENRFNCTNGRCINVDLKGNGIDDCGDNSDEPVEATTASETGNDVTTTTTPVVTGTNEETLTTTKLSIETTSTDVTVDETSVQTDVFTCASGLIIDSEFVCDGTDDCKDGLRSDECSCSRSFICDNMKCINDHLVCDGVDDCGDGSDEVGCIIPGSESETYDTSKTTTATPSTGKPAFETMEISDGLTTVEDILTESSKTDVIEGSIDVIDESDYDKDDDVTSKTTTTTSTVKPALESTESSDGLTTVEYILTKSSTTDVIKGNIDAIDESDCDKYDDVTSKTTTSNEKPALESTESSNGLTTVKDILSESYTTDVIEQSIDVIDDTDCDKDDDVTRKSATTTTSTEKPVLESTESSNGLTTVEDILSESSKTDVFDDVTYGEVNVPSNNKNTTDTDDERDTATGATEENKNESGDFNTPEIPSRFSSVKPNKDAIASSKPDSQGNDKDDAISMASHIAFSSITISLAIARIIIP